ncbi:hypothetical protein EW145_g4752 [Phellinidium pouzarii]|uniref:Amino acid transporter transmembrane domain-containing protein n=1 Tax=Phellinidium pouzarii TaxID=167371 RepID=A0A4S4L2X8_9AGAM|nr:hypothetical protein EW145_g4752 [Phellinidium pouzarii]
MPGAEMSPTSRLSSDSSSSLSSNNHFARPSLGQHSTSALILVHDSEENSNTFAFSDDEDEDPRTEISLPDVVLAPSLVFGYLLSPCLKLGAMLILSSQSPLKVSLPALLVFSFLSVFSRQIWFLLARYTRKSEVGDIVAEAIIIGREKDGRRTFIRAVTRCGSGIVRVLLATVYLKGAKSSMGQLWPVDVSPVSPSLTLSVIFIIILIPLCLASSLSSRRLVYSTLFSNVLYIAWMCGIVYAHAKGLLNTDNVMIAQGRLLQDITSVAFAFSSLSTLQLYSGMVGLYASGNKKEKRYLSISSISLSAAVVGTAMILPLLFPSVKTHGDSEPTEDASLVQALIATLTAFILLLAIPPLIATSPPLPALRRATKRPLGKYVLLVLLFSLSLLPSLTEPVLEDIVVLLVLLSTYFLPALLHIILHNLRRPLSILVSPQSQPFLRTASGSESESGGAESQSRDPDTEELLLRKERALQRRRFARRLAWDLGVWILLLPVGGGGMVWAIGRFVDAW